MKTHTSSGAVVYISVNGVRKYLIMLRERSNSWHLPKGTQLPGESLEETAIREVKEETGLDIDIGKYLSKLHSTFERKGETIQKETHYFLGQPKNIDLPLAGMIHDNEHDKIDFYDYKTAVDRLVNFTPYEKEANILTVAEKALA